MADIKFSQLTPINVAQAADYIPIIDVSEKLMSESGSNAVISVGDLTTSFFTGLGDGSISSAKLQTNPTFRGNVVLPDTTTIGLVNKTEIGFLSGLRNNIQYQLDNPTIPEIPGKLSINCESIDSLNVNGPVFIKPATSNYANTTVAIENRTNTYLSLHGSNVSDFAFLRQISTGADNYHLSLDLHDNANDPTIGQSFSIRQVSGINSIQTNFNINGNGNVGIGTDSPAYKLDVIDGQIRTLNRGGPSALEIGNGTASNQYAHIDLVGDTTYTDYGFRMIRGNTGENTSSQLVHRGTGNFDIMSQHDARIRMLTNSVERMRIASGGIVFIGNGNADVAPNDAIISATGGSGSNVAGASFTICGGISTGTGAGGAIIFNTSPSGTTGSTENDAVQRTRITFDGKTIIGSSVVPFETRFGTNPITPNIQILSNTAGSTTLNSSSSALFGRFSNDAEGSKHFFVKTRGASTGTHTVVNSGDHIGWLTFGASDGTQIVESARIEVSVDKGVLWPATQIVSGKRYRIFSPGTTNWTAIGAPNALEDTVFTANNSIPTGDGSAYEEPAANNVPGIITFLTNIGGTAAPVESMRIDKKGNIGIGLTQAAVINSSCLLQLESTSQGFRPPVMTTTQRNNIASTTGGPTKGLIIYNSSSNKLNFYNGTAWEAVTSSVGA